MSRENVERVRGILEDFRADKSEFDAEGMLTKIAGEELMDPDIEWDASEAAFDLRGVHRGVEAVRRWWGEWLAAWETLEFEYELVDAGDRVVALIDNRMRGLNTRASRCPWGTTRTSTRFRDGLVVHWKLYLRQSEALKAVGHSEQDARTGR